MQALLLTMSNLPIIHPADKIGNVALDKFSIQDTSYMQRLLHNSLTTGFRYLD